MAKHRILLVDDDTDILEINRSFLTNEGYDVSVATSIATTLQKVETNSFDCIVLDIMLPDGTAYDLPSKIHVYSNAPIIFLSAKDQLEDKITGFKAGGDDYMTKPYNLPELSARISAHIRRNMARDGFLMEFPPLTMNVKTREVVLNDVPVHLTNREFDILRLHAFRKVQSPWQIGTKHRTPLGGQRPRPFRITCERTHFHGKTKVIPVIRKFRQRDNKKLPISLDISQNQLVRDPRPVPIKYFDPNIRSAFP